MSDIWFTLVYGRYHVRKKNYDLQAGFSFINSATISRQVECEL
jgi:hypothetical protein